MGSKTLKFANIKNVISIMEQNEAWEELMDMSEGDE
jgi:hypothetical protein